MERMAAILRPNAEGKEEWQLIRCPATADVVALRRKGAVIMRLVQTKKGNMIERAWVSDSGIPIVVSTFPIQEQP